MKRKERWDLSEEEKGKLIANLTAEIPALRAKLGISQGDLAKVIGISRQTLSAIERDERDMSWDTYLSMLFFFDYNKQTQSTIRDAGIFPTEILRQFNGGKEAEESGAVTMADEGVVEIFDKLDEQAMEVLKTTLIVEYTRCSGLPVADVVNLFSTLKLEKPKKVSEVTKRTRRN